MPFEWGDLRDRREISKGSYGSAEFPRYVPKGDGKATLPVEIIAKRPIDVIGFEKKFAKEDRLLQSVKGQENIALLRLIH